MRVSAAQPAAIATNAAANSDLPGLLGLEALRDNRALLDFTTNRLYFCGPGDIRIEKAVPPGTECFQLEVAPSGHIVLPCCEFAGNGVSSRPSLSLHMEGRDSSGSRTAEAAIPSYPWNTVPIEPPPYVAEAEPAPNFVAGPPSSRL